MHTLTLAYVVDIPFSALFDVAGGAADAVMRMARAARNGFCRLYRDYPQFVIGTGTNPAQQFALELFLNRVCPDPTEQPPPRQSPFQGGQCHFEYRIDYVLYAPPLGDFPPYTDSGFRIRWGKIQPPVVRRTETNTWVVELVHGTAANPNAGERTSLLSIAANSYGKPEFQQFTVTPANGQPDQCGSPAPVWPDVQPPPDALNYNTPIEIGDQVFNIPVSIPFVNFDVDFNFRPQFYVNVGGLQFNFDMGGVDVNFGPNIEMPINFPTGVDPRPPGDRPPVVNPRDPNKCPPCPDINLQPILNAIADLDADLVIVAENVEKLLDCDRCARPAINSESLVAVDYPNLQSGTLSLGPNAVWVRIRTTQEAENARKQPGGAGPDVIYSGWYSMGSGNAPSDRNAVRYRNQAMPVEEGFDTFTFTMYTGHKATVTIYSIPEEE